MGDAVSDNLPFGSAAEVVAGDATPRVLVVCEHASNHVPAALNGLGLSAAQLASHIAWDPGAAAVARRIATALGAPLVAGRLSRLVYDCNRPPDAADAIVEISEDRPIPGNRGLSDTARAARVAGVHDPFKAALTAEIARHRASLSLLVTVHSFTPVYRGVRRGVEIGLLHGSDARFADRMLARVPATCGFDLRRNEPYSASDGVTHTLERHGTANGLLNVMIELRNDLLAHPQDQAAMADLLAPWIAGTLASFDTEAAA